MSVSLFDLDPPAGLDDQAQPRRHHDRRQPRPHPDPAQPRAARSHRGVSRPGPPAPTLAVRYRDTQPGSPTFQTLVKGAASAEGPGDPSLRRAAGWSFSRPRARGTGLRPETMTWTAA